MWNSDGDLIEACRRGEAGAWSDLIDRYQALVYSVPRRFRFSEELSEEVFQRTWVSCFRSLGRLTDDRRLAGWLRTTATNHARMILRKDRKNIELDPDLTADGSGEPPEEQLRRLEEAQLLAISLDRLDGRCRALLDRLFFSAGRVSYQEIGAALDMPVGSIGPTRSRCLEKLKAHLREVGFPE